MSNDYRVPQVKPSTGGMGIERIDDMRVDRIGDARDHDNIAGTYLRECEC